MEWTNDARTELQMRQVERHEDGRYHEQMARDHDLGALSRRLVRRCGMSLRCATRGWRNSVSRARP